MDLIDKRVVLTGGASGIGAAVLRRLADKGARCVHVADQNQAALSALISKLSPQCDIQGATLDVTDREALTNWFNAADAAMGGIDIVINNAGIMSGPVEFPETPIAAMMKVIDVNLCLCSTKISMPFRYGFFLCAGVSIPNFVMFFLSMPS